jgi:hypothetical protein
MNEDANQKDDASKEKMYEIIGAQALGWNYSTLDEKRREAARELGRQIIEMNKKIMDMYGPAYLQKLHEKAVYPRGADKDPLKAEWLQDVPLVYYKLYRFERICREYLSTNDPVEKIHLKSAVKNIFVDSGAILFINSESVKSHLSMLKEDDVYTILTLLKRNPALLRYQLFSSNMNTALNVAESRSFWTGGANVWFDRAEESYINMRIRPVELKILEAIKENELSEYKDYFEKREGFIELLKEKMGMSIRYSTIKEGRKRPRNFTSDFVKSFSLAGTLRAKNTDPNLVDKIYDEYYKVLGLSGNNGKLDDFANRIATNETVEIKDDAERAIAEHLINVGLARGMYDNNKLVEISITPEEKALATEEVRNIKKVIKDDIERAKSQERLRAYKYKGKQKRKT